MVLLIKWLPFDLNFFKELAILTPDQLVDKVKDMMEVAYQLSVEESKLVIFKSFIVKNVFFKAHQIARGKLLNILDKNDKE